MAVPWRLPSFRRHRCCFLRQASWFISGPSNGHLSGGRGQDPPDLAVPWARKPRFSVRGSRSCAELAIVHHLRASGWDGVWVNAFRGELRTQWFPAPAARQLAETGAPGWAAEAFSRLRAANGGTLSGFFDVFAWREPGQAAFVEAKVGPDRIKPTQLRFVEIALRFHRLEDFMIVEIPGLPRLGYRPASPEPPRARPRHGARRPSGRVPAAGTCSLRSAGQPRPALVMAPCGNSSPGAQRGGPRTT
jgi:hypothetical protein